jgi:hypothetical protein
VILEEIHFCSYFLTFPNTYETATDAVTTVFEKKVYICYNRFVVNFSVYFLVALLAQNKNDPATKTALDCGNRFLNISDANNFVRTNF